MTSEMEALGRRAVACPGWKWMPGMAASIPQWGHCRVAAIVDGAAVWVGECPDGVIREWEVSTEDEGRAVPDFGDDASRGILLALVRGVLGEPNCYPRYDAVQKWWSLQRDCWGEDQRGEDLLNTGKWGIDGVGDFIVEQFEVALLVAALEAAHG